MATDIQLRPATTADRAACYEICLRTSDNGSDGSHLHADPDALGHIYVGPYLALDPAFAFVLEDEAGVCGYCVGTPDSRTFYQRFERDWLPPIQSELRADTAAGNYSHAATEQALALSRELHQLLLQPAPLMYFPEHFTPWPAHAHIDLLPRAQGRGWGRRLMELQMRRLREAGASGLHLAVAPGNTRAQAFYHRLGFTILQAGPNPPPDTLFLGRKL